jgi:hypothetical protein
MIVKQERMICRFCTRIASSQPRPVPSYVMVARPHTHATDSSAANAQAVLRNIGSVQTSTVHAACGR